MLVFTFTFYWKHMAHLVQAVVWTAGLDDRLADSGLDTLLAPVGIRSARWYKRPDQYWYACIQRAGISPVKRQLHPFYLGRFNGGTVFRCIMISPGKVFLGRIEG